MLLTRRLAFGGIASALVLAALSVSYVSPTADLALFTLSSFFIAMTVIETDYKTAASAYAASGILLTVLYGIYFSAPFLGLFGLYPLLKGFLEQRMKPLPAFAAKAGFFGVLLAAVYFVFREMSASALSAWSGFLPVSLPSWLTSAGVFLALAFIVLFIYDIALTMLIAFYTKRIRKALGKFAKK